MYTAQIEKAIQAACVLHDGQVRKGVVPIPFVSHVFSVFQLVGDYTDVETTLIAALLHDTLEDTDYTTVALEEDFGPTVRTIVEAVTEDTSTTDWMERKEQYLASIKAAGASAWLISAADKIHNMRSMIEQYYDDVASYVVDFGHYRTDGIAFLRSFGDELVANYNGDIVTEYQHVLQEFITFNEYVKTTIDQEN